MRPRRRVLLDPVPSGRSRRDPDEASAEARGRSRQRAQAATAIGEVLAGDALDDVPSWLAAALSEVVATARRRVMPDGDVRMTPALTGRDYLYRLRVHLEGCDEVIAFREAQCGFYEIRPNSCKTRVCPDCERTRSAELVRVYRSILRAVVARRQSFAVLTLRNVPRLAPGLDALSAALTRLRGRSIFRGGRCRWRFRDGRPGHSCRSMYCQRWTTGRHRSDRNCPDFRHEPVVGGVAATEVTHSGEGWHPHVNLLMDAPHILQAELADTWRAVTCGDPRHRRAGWCPDGCDEGSFMVWIQQVKPGTVREAIKYVTKPAELLGDATLLAEFLLAVRGRRMVQGFGSFFNVELEEPEDPEPTVTLAVELVGVHDRSGRPVVRRYKLPKLCRQCGRDTALEAGGCTYEPPIPVRRVDVRLRNGAATWMPHWPAVAGAAPPSHRPADRVGCGACRAGETGSHTTARP